MQNFYLVTSALFIFFNSIASADTIKPIRIVGSTAVYGFSTIVAERVSKTKGVPAPVIEATGTGGGIKIFCAGKSKTYPDAVNTSRPMTEHEKKICTQNGVGDIIEIKIGYDGIVIGAHPSQSPINLSRTDLSKALSERVEDPHAKECHKWQRNPYHYWDQINPAYPHRKIIVFGPTASLATRELFEERVIKEGCLEYVSTDLKKQCSTTIREDGAFIEVAEHESVVIQKLDLKPEALGLVGYGYYTQNPSKLTPLPIDGVMPSPESIASGAYPLARPLYIYVKRHNLEKKPVLKVYLQELLSESAMGHDGYLLDKGLIPYSEEERQSILSTINQ